VAAARGARACPAAADASSRRRGRCGAGRGGGGVPVPAWHSLGDGGNGEGVRPHGHLRDDDVDVLAGLVGERPQSLQPRPTRLLLLLADEVGAG